MFVKFLRRCCALASDLHWSACASVFVISALLLAGAQSYAASPLDMLDREHPRLFLHDRDLPALKHAIATDPFVKQSFEDLKSYADQLLTMPPNVYLIAGPEHTLLDVSRNTEGRVFALAGVYRISGDRRYADRAIKEMLAAAAFPDWYPIHFLDTGEMAATLGLGYDWLYAVMSPAERATIRNAIATKGIDPWLERIRSGEAAHHEHNNWNQVCNGGESIGALAIADEDPQRAEAILDHAHEAIGDIMKLFAPDGGFEEGPTYWLYATAYNVMYLDALETALGTDFGMSNAVGFDKTGDYHIQSDGPTYLLANFGDAGLGSATPTAQMFWLAKRFGKPFYAGHERDVARVAGQPAYAAVKQHDEYATPARNRFALMLLLWSAEQSQIASSGADGQLPLEESFARVGQAYIRSAWNDPDAWYVAFKGGDSHASHGHLDLGSFVLDAEGKRWASDLGPDNYGLPGYFGPQRWTYYRMKTEGHNTLTVDGGNQDLDAKAPLISSGAMGIGGSDLYAIADLGQAYKGKLAAWKRGVALIDKRRMLVQDEITPSQHVKLTWNFHTFATVEITPDGRAATLSLGDKKLQAKILAPAGARFSTASTEARVPQEPNPGLTNLIIPVEGRPALTTIAVLFSALTDTAETHIKPLADWK